MEPDGIDLTIIKATDIEAVLAFRTYFEKPGPFGKVLMADPPAHDIYTCLDEVAEAFYQACYKHHFVQPFPWDEWIRERQRLVEEGAGIEELEFDEIVRLITVLIRGDRFCTGLLVDWMNDGRMGRILARLSKIKPRCP